MKETSKSILRRIHDSRYVAKYFVGNGIDIGSGEDSIGLYQELFPLMSSVKSWDLPDGDAQFLHGLNDESFDFVHSSHCLEHMVDPTIALENWLRILKPNGHLICLVPDEDLYEQGVFPSTFNNDHKWTFTINKSFKSWSTNSINLFNLLNKVSNTVEIVKIELLNGTFRHQLPRFDQTLTPIAECAIEFVLRKRTINEINQGGRLPIKYKYLTKSGFELLTGIKI